MVENTLSEPEFVGGLLMTVDGMQTMTPEPNPRYVSGALLRNIAANMAIKNPSDIAILK